MLSLPKAPIPARSVSDGVFSIPHRRRGQPPRRGFSDPAAGLSTTLLKRIRRFSKPDNGGEAYTLSAYLVAQIGKNATLSKRERIGGVQLLELAKNEIRAAQERVGGQMVFLEMEHGNAFLESFYRDNGFVSLGQRNSEEDSAIYDQMFIFLK